MKILATVTYSRQVEIEIPDCLLGLSERKLRQIQKDILQSPSNGSEKMEITEAMPANPLDRTELWRTELETCLLTRTSWVDKGSVRR